MRLPAVETLPRFVRVRQLLPRDEIPDMVAAVRTEVRRLLGPAGEPVGEGPAPTRRRALTTRPIGPGTRVAVTAGSRGINQIDRIIRAVCDELEAAGAHPFIVPAMGSHGGATPEGQVELLAEFGITEAAMAVPILASMDTVELGQTTTGARVFMDRHAYEADATVVVARVKAHTGFRAPIESGLCKMLAVGLGKQRGADAMHRHGLAASIPEAAEILLERANIAFGVAVVENAYDRPYRVVAVPPGRFHETDRELLHLSNTLLPRVPFDPLDLLIVDWMGKNLSGSGLDPNIIGMWRRLGGERRPDFNRIAVLNLTPESHGNAVGIGMADFTTRRLVDAIDYHRTYMNALTARVPESVRVPVTLANDREAIAVALAASTAGDAPRVARIKSTLHLDELWISEALVAEAAENPQLELLGEPQPLPFDAEGNLIATEH